MYGDFSLRAFLRPVQFSAQLLCSPAAFAAQSEGGVLLMRALPHGRQKESGPLLAECSVYRACFLSFDCSRLGCSRLGCFLWDHKAVSNRGSWDRALVITVMKSMESGQPCTPRPVWQRHCTPFSSDTYEYSLNAQGLNYKGICHTMRDLTATPGTSYLFVMPTKKLACE